MNPEKIDLKIDDLVQSSFDEMVDTQTRLIKKTISDHLDDCVKHIVDDTARAKARAEVEELFYKYYEVYLDHDRSKPGNFYNVKIRHRGSK